MSQEQSLHELRPFWSRFFDFTWKFGVFLILAVCIPRFFVVLQANASQKYHWVGLIMTVYAIAPFIFLNGYGRKSIGLTKPKRSFGLVHAFVAGVFFSVVLHYLGQSLYGNSFENWYVYIAKSYKIPSQITDTQRHIMFSIMALVGMSFSPIGEELFFRGIVHVSIEKSLGERKASWIDSAAFAFTHIAHFGLVFVQGAWRFLMVPTMIWVLSMFLVSLVFLYFKKYTSSIWGAVLCHSGFNLGMIYCIFYLM